VEEAGADVEGLDDGGAHGIQIRRNLAAGIVEAFAAHIHDIHDRGREDVRGLEDDVSVLVRDAVEGLDVAGHELLHDVFGLQVLAVEILQLLVIADLPGGVGADAVIRLDDDRIADFLDELLAQRQRADHVVAGDRDIGLLIEGLHVGLQLVAHDVFRLVAGGDVEIRSEAGILLEPEFVV